MASTVFNFVGRESRSAYDGIIAPENFDDAEIIAYVSGTKTKKPTVSVCYYYSSPACI